MKSINASGKTVEDAVKAGLKELGLESSDVTIDVLDVGSPGLFGMFGRLAKVRLTVKEEEDDIKIEMPVLTLGNKGLSVLGETERKAEKKAERKKSEPKPEEKRAESAKEKPVSKPAWMEATEKKPGKSEQAEMPSAPEKPAEQPVESVEASAPRKREPRRESRPERAPRPEREPRPDPVPVEPDLPPLDVDALSESGKRAYNFLRETTQRMGVNVDIRMVESEEQLLIKMTGDVLGVLIGRRGDTLDALQYLTSLVVNRGREAYLRVSLDSENYRARREEALRRLALRMASKARRTGRKVVLEPMNPYERRILHSALQNNPYVATHSEGEEPYRRVVITLK